MWCAKKLQRGEIWQAKSVCDCYLKRLLLRMAEWQAKARNGPDYETWHDGRFFDKWADPRVLESLRQAYARYDDQDIRRALLATMDIFGPLSRETAELLGFTYPILGEEKATGLVTQLFGKNDHGSLS